MPGPAPVPNPGGRAGAPCPEFPPGTVLAVSWWDGVAMQRELMEVADLDGPRWVPAIPWERIDSWIEVSAGDVTPPDPGGNPR